MSNDKLLHVFFLSFPLGVYIWLGHVKHAHCTSLGVSSD